jgi:hypothetical protein
MLEVVETEKPRAELPEVSFGFPQVVNVTFPGGLIARQWARLRRRSPTTTIDLLAAGGDIWLDSYCAGKASVNLYFLHPCTKHVPVDTVLLTRWIFNTTALDVQPFSQPVRGDHQHAFTQVTLSTQLHESDINKIKDVVGKVTLSSGVPQAHGIPYHQILDLVVRTVDGRKHREHEVRITAPYVILHASGDLSRKISDL